MEQLNKRQKKFLELLLEETDYTPIQSFADRLGVSGKTVNEDVKVLRNSLKKYAGEILAKTGKGICLSKETRMNMELLNCLYSEQNAGGLESTERRAQIVKNMLIHSDQFISLQKLSEYYYVGKSSIVNDLKYIEDWLAEFQLSLERTKQGTRVAGREKDIREAITALLYKNFSRGREASVMELNDWNHLDRDTLQSLLEIFKPEDIIFVMDLLEELQTAEALDTNDIYYKNLLTHILICIQRVRDGKRVKGQDRKDREEIEERDRYDSAVRIARKIQNQYGIDIGEEETFYIYQYICSLVTHGAAAQGLRKKQDLGSRMAEELTKYMSEILDVKFMDEDVLMEGLLLHIRPLLNRLEYHIKIANPLLEDMQNSYPQMLGLCQAVCGLISKKYGLEQISLDEIANLATYYQTMLVKQTEPITVLVVCHSGYGTSQLLAARLKQEFTNLRIRDVISLRKLKQMSLEGIHLIISTVPVELPGIPSLVVSTFLSDKDISAVRNSVYAIEQRDKKGYESIEKALGEDGIYLDQNVKRKGKPLCSTRFTRKLELHIWEKERAEGALTLDIRHADGSVRADIYSTDEDVIKGILSDFYRLALDEEETARFLKCHDTVDVWECLRRRQTDTVKEEIVKEENVFLDLQADSKEEVIDLLLKPVLKQKDVTDEAKLRRAVWERENMAFTGIGSQIALVHAVTEAVTEVKTVILRLKTPVDWAEGKDYPEDTKMVRLAVLFLAPEEERREDILKIKELVLRLGNRENARNLMQAKTKEEIVNILTAR